MKKKLLAWCLTAILTVGIYPVAGAVSFPDVPAGADYVEAVAALADMGVITGDGNGNFNPDATITRAEVAAIMCRLMGAENEADAAGDPGFDDVPDGHWAAGYVKTATRLGVINGDGTGNFRPGDPVTYEQVVKMLVSAWDYEDWAQEEGGWPDGYIAVAEELGFLKNISFAGTDHAPRWAVAVLTYNTLYD